MKLNTVIKKSVLKNLSDTSHTLDKKDTKNIGGAAMVTRAQHLCPPPIYSQYYHCPMI
ncbi:hypothetical protein [Pseudoalteromonas citrea]|nr:hypothetical protein [Pseudoalteromonas citrea]